MNSNPWTVLFSLFDLKSPTIGALSNSPKKAWKDKKPKEFPKHHHVEDFEMTLFTHEAIVVYIYIYIYIFKVDFVLTWD